MKPKLFTSLVVTTETEQYDVGRGSLKTIPTLTGSRSMTPLDGRHVHEGTVSPQSLGSLRTGVSDRH